MLISMMCGKTIKNCTKNIKNCTKLPKIAKMQKKITFSKKLPKIAAAIFRRDRCEPKKIINTLQ